MGLITVQTHFAARENEARLSQKKRVDRVVKEQGNPHIISNKEEERGLSMLSSMRAK